jgi:hypothetical protein
MVPRKTSLNVCGAVADSPVQGLTSGITLVIADQLLPAHRQNRS